MEIKKGFVFSSSKSVDYDYRMIFYTVNVWKDQVSCVFKGSFSSNDQETKVNMTRKAFVDLIRETHKSSDDRNIPAIEDSMTRNEDHTYILTRDKSEVRVVPRNKRLESPIDLGDPLDYKAQEGRKDPSSESLSDPTKAFPLNTSKNSWWNK